MKVSESLEDFAEASYDLHEIAPKLDPQGFVKHILKVDYLKLDVLLRTLTQESLVRLLVVVAIMSSVLMSMIMYSVHG